MAKKKIEAHFSPNGGCMALLTGLLAKAKRTVRVMAYMVTAPDMAQALLAAHQRGVDVQVIHDETGALVNGSKVGVLIDGGIPVYGDSAHRINHNKVIIIDSKIVVTGSFNFSTSAEKRNAENLIVIRDVAVSKIYTDDWTGHLTHSTRYTAAPKGIGAAIDYELFDPEG